MISCIICSRKTNISSHLIDNIHNSIGCEYELVIIDNSQNKYSIQSAYSLGISQAKGDVYCFMHDDIEFKTNNWGNNVVEALSNNDNIGVIGVIGSQFMPSTVCTWWESSFVVGEILQGVESVKIGTPVMKMTDVVVVDGLWFCIHKRTFVYSKIRFVEDIYAPFHCYDIDICMMSVYNNMRVVVIPNIMIQHFSWGNIYSGYKTSLSVFFDRWKKILPISRGIYIDDNMMNKMSVLLGLYQKSIWRIANIERTFVYRLCKAVLKRLGIYDKIINDINE